ncbi:hypothetical protein C8R46DRAFT_1157139 [Mycena filopes]|nr:hypothetical protein C8R46DRAFT_1157139 [Mycena filopes]
MAFSSTRPSSPVNSPHITQDDDSATALSRLDSDMRDKERPCLEIHLDNEHLCMQGTGANVEPARLTGHVALYLAESTPIKEITLQFRGKARMPPPPHESMHIGNSSIHTYIVCTHDWSFLEGEKKHSHTLKAGRHYFPFQLELGGSLPSSLLRANAVRPGLNSNLHAVQAVHIMRSFTSEALEYQQTLEIENTWPDKLMYSIMIPHKAWAATDTLTAALKFSPLLKGVGVLTVNTSIHETTKLLARSAVQEYTRVVASVKHEILGGKAVEIAERPRYYTPPSTQSPGNAPLDALPGVASTSSSYFPSPPGTADSPSLRESVPEIEPAEEQGQDDIVTFISMAIPSSVAPTHSPDPISISHRLRWSILIMNPDGHTSELRCSLPVHILDQRLLKEARAHTAATRRLLLGGAEVPPADEEEIELPSYKAHVRDRVANMYLPEAATVRITNPWMALSASASTTPPAFSPLANPHSGHSSPLDAYGRSHLPHAPGAEASTPLDWVNSELLLSMQAGSASVPFVPPAARRPHPSTPTRSPQAAWRAGHRATAPSRRSSRASSPERRSSNNNSDQPPPAHETHIHSGGHASRNLHSVFNASMKPFTALAPHWLSSARSASSHPRILPPPRRRRQRSAHSEQQRQQQARSRPGLTSSDADGVLLQRAYSEIPDYGTAARGFIGGVPPLSSMQGLPSYEETERARGAPSTVILQ